MTTQISTIVNAMPANLFAATEYLRSAYLYQMQLSCDADVLADMEKNLEDAKDLNMSVFEGLVESTTDTGDRLDLIKYIAASIGNTTSTIYTDGTHAVLEIVDKNIENMEALADALRLSSDDITVIIKDENNVLTTIAGIYDLNKSTILLACPHNMAIYQSKATEQNRDYFVDLLNKDEKLKAEVEAYMAQFN